MSSNIGDSTLRAEPRRCAKCDGKLEEGFVLDNTDGGGRVRSEWVRGAPETSRWGIGVKLKGKLKLPVVTYRCTKCGYLESYAPLT